MYSYLNITNVWCNHTHYRTNVVFKDFELSFSLKLTETSSRYTRKISGTTALQEALKEKQQHIEQLLAERDLERAEVAKATSHVGEVEQELVVLREGQEQVRDSCTSPPCVPACEISANALNCFCEYTRHDVLRNFFLAGPPSWHGVRKKQYSAC